MDNFEYNEINIDSWVGDEGTTNHPIFNLQPLIADCIGIRIVSAQVPFSWYVINNDNNTMTLTDNISAGPTNTIITLPIGNYNAHTIADALTIELTKSVFANYTVVYDSILQKLKITSNKSEAWYLTFPSTLFQQSLMTYIGGSDIQVNNTAAGGTGILILPFTVQITGPNYLLLNSNLGSRIRRNTRTNGYSTWDPPVLAKIPITCNPGEIIFYNDPQQGNYYFEITDSSIQSIDFYFTLGPFETPSEVDFNGQAFSLVLGVLTSKTSIITKGNGFSSKRARIDLN